MNLMSERHQRLSGLMGLCVRARQCIFGEKACLKAMRDGEIGLLLMDETISEAMAEKYEGVCQRMKIPMIRLEDGFLWAATGKNGMVMAVRKGSFAERMRACAGLPEDGAVRS